MQVKKGGAQKKEQSDIYSKQAHQPNSVFLFISKEE